MRGAGRSAPRRRTCADGGPRRRPPWNGRASSSTASSGCRARWVRPPAADLVPRRRGQTCRSWRSTRPASTRTRAVDGPAVTAIATVTFGALKRCTCWPSTAAERSNWWTSGSAPSYGAARVRPGRVRRRRPLPCRPTEKVHPGGHRRRGRVGDLPGAAVLCTGAAVLATRGWSASPGRPQTPPGPMPEVVATDDIRRRAHPGVGVGPASARTTAAGRCSPHAGAGRPPVHRRRRRHPARGTTTAAAVAGSDRITPHDREFARVAGRWAPTGSLVDRWPRRRSG